MKLFHDGALRGFSLSELPEGGSRYDEPDAALRYVEQILGHGQRLGFRVIVTLHPTPGFSKSDYWDNPSLQADIVRQWGQIAHA